jgi:hypothetical protein
MFPVELDLIINPGFMVFSEVDVEDSFWRKQEVLQGGKVGEQWVRLFVIE